MSRIGRIDAPAAVISLQGTVLNSAALQLGANVITQGVNIKASSTNAGNIYVGGSSGVTTSTGYKLAPGEFVFLPIKNTNLVFLRGDSATNTVYVLGS
jgi:hypothetical protein